MRMETKGDIGIAIPIINGPNSVRYVSESYLTPIRFKILYELFISGPLTRYEISDKLRIARSTCDENLTHLVASGYLVREVIKTGRRGRPQFIYRLKRKEDYN